MSRISSGGVLDGGASIGGDDAFGMDLLSMLDVSSFMESAKSSGSWDCVWSVFKVLIGGLIECGPAVILAPKRSSSSWLGLAV